MQFIRELADRANLPCDDPDSESEWSDDGDEFAARGRGNDGSSREAIEVAVLLKDDLTIEPDEIEIEVGRPVRMTIQNAGRAWHDFTIDGISAQVSAQEGDSLEAAADGDENDHFDLHLELDGESTGTLEFTPEEAGEYAFHCTVEGHTESGMTGTLIVT